MKFLKGFAGAIAGALISTVFCWGMLYLYGILVLRGHGSLFDTNPLTAKIFFITWAILSLLFALAGAAAAVLMTAARRT